MHINSLLRSIGILLVFSCASCHRTYQLPVEKKMDNSIANYGNKVAAQYGMKLILVGNVTDNALITYCLTFTNDKTLTLEEGKKLAMPIVRDFLTMLLHDPAVKDYCNYKNHTSQYSFCSPPRPENMGLKIAFWNQKVTRPEPPYLAEIRYVAGKFQYFESDPQTQELKLVCEETYSQAAGAR